MKKSTLPASESVCQDVQNISEIALIEQNALDIRTAGEIMGDFIAQQAGQLWFIGLHCIWFAVWILLNANLVRGVHAFDPFPYQFLTFVVSLESIFFSLFILMSQNRANKQGDARSQLDLQINLLAEQESTKVLEMLQQLCGAHNLAIANDPQLEILKRPTSPRQLLQKLKDTLPGVDK